MRSDQQLAVPRLGGPAALCAASSDAARAPHRRGARRSSNALGSARYRRGGARGLEVSPGSLLQNELVQRQVGHRPAEAAILLLEFLQPPDLIGLQPAVLLPPTIIRHPLTPIWRMPSAMFWP